MSKRMHIGYRRYLLGGVRTYCGRVLRAGDGAPEGAPLCPTCQRRAGRDTDERKGGRR